MRLKVVLISLLMIALRGELLTEKATADASPDKHVPAFVYHRFGDNRYPSTNISNKNFEAQLKYLSTNGYISLTFSEAHEYLQNRSKPIKAVCLTVDDGFKSFLENGLPLLQKYGMKATVFVNTETVGSSDFMTWDELRQLVAAGIEIGNHSHSHDYYLNDTTATRMADFKADLIKAQQLLTESLDIEPVSFAYPYGEFDMDMEQVVREMGFKAAAIQSSGVMHSAMNPLQSPRFPMSDRYGKMGSFIEKVTMLPLKVNEVETIATGYNGSEDNPRVIFRFSEKGLSLPSLQCFTQGKPCTKSIRIDKEGNVQLTVKSKEKLTARRTLYTITVSDEKGKWHWYSHTWVIPSIK